MIANVISTNDLWSTVNYVLGPDENVKGIDFSEKDLLSEKEQKFVFKKHIEAALAFKKQLELPKTCNHKWKER